MKALSKYFTLILVLLVFPATVMAGPKAMAEAPVYEFAPVPEGQGFNHAFIIKNLGDDPLKIVDVIPP